MIKNKETTVMKKLISFMDRVASLIELILALFVTIGAVATLVTIVVQEGPGMMNGMVPEELNHLLEEIFSVVIAVEFLKMLLQPTSQTVIEVLIFLIARHMIVKETGAVQDLLSVISICILFAAKLLIEKYGRDDSSENIIAKLLHREKKDKEAEQ